MCGISGINLSLKDIGLIDVDKLAKELLLGIQSRGRDATGAAWYDEEGALVIQKDAMSATNFVKYLDLYEGATNVILHTRMATNGSPSNNHNNHPVVTGNIVGVHNGVIYNDDSVFKQIGPDRRIAEVDTEAIFAAIAYGQELDILSQQPLIGGSVTECLEEITGGAAIAWQEIQGDPDVMFCSRLSSNPFVYGQTENGSFIFASTKEILDRACKNADVELTFTQELDEQTMITVQSGKIIDVQTWEPWKSTYTPRSSVSTFPSSSGVVKVTSETTTTVDPVVLAPQLVSVPSSALQEGTVEFMSTVDYQELYESREANIDRFMSQLTNDASTIETTLQLGGFIRPGDWALAGVGYGDDMKIVLAQVAHVPTSFPTGDYILKVRVPVEGGTFVYLPVANTFEDFEILNRQAQEFLDGCTTEAQLSSCLETLIENSQEFTTLDIDDLYRGDTDQTTEETEVEKIIKEALEGSTKETALVPVCLGE